MNAALRFVAATLAGMVVVFVLIIAVEFFSEAVHPVPKDFSGTPEEMCRHVERIPPWVLAVAIPMWAVAAFAGTWTAQRIGNIHSSATIGLLVAAALVLNLSMLPYPIWFKVGCVIAIPIALFAGSRMAMRPRVADESSGT